MSRSTIRATVVYEDARSGNAPFGLHRLVSAIVVRRTGLQHHEVDAALKCLPAGGVPKLTLKLSEDFAPRGEPMLVLLDGDRAAELLACDDSDDAISAALHERAVKEHGERQVAHFEVFVLRLAGMPSNTEGLIHSIRTLAPDLVSTETFQRALDKKPADRDTVFQEFARQSAELQERLLESAPALKQLVARAQEFVDSSAPGRT